MSLDKQMWVFRLPNDSEVWLGGLDDKERVEKVLGQEHATIYLNECSQISYEARGIAVTRLAQSVIQAAISDQPLTLRMYYDCNPPSKMHWSYRLFVEHRSPDTKKPIPNPGDYAFIQMNPGDNAENLPANYIKELEALPLRLRRRFAEGNFADATPNALFTEEILDKWRHEGGDLPDFQRIGIAVDPSGAGDKDNEGNDDIGVMVGALATDGNVYILEDLTCKLGPHGWGRVVASAYDRVGADFVCAEINFGGAMVEHVIKTAKPNVNYKEVKASRGKAVRAEPVSALMEQGRVRMVGRFPALEDELCAFNTSGYTGENSPNRADAVIWLVSEFFPSIVADKPKWGKINYPKQGIV